MRCFHSTLWGAVFLLILCGGAAAGSEQALRLRSQNDLSEFAPPEGFLAGNFLADETDPVFIFGKVRDFARSLACPATWLIEAAERRRIEAQTLPSGPVEYSLYLEADCPGRIAYYVFVDRSFNPDQWLEWRRPFHRSKADPHYNAAKASLDQAAQNGFTVAAELRFVAVNGDLLLKRPEDVLVGDLQFKPIYDLKNNRALAK